MKALKNSLPVILLILVELAIGILLLIDPEGFTNTVIRVFGAVLLVIGLIYIIRFAVAKAKNEYASFLMVVLGVLSLAIGFVCTFMTAWIKTLFAIGAVLYGIFLIITGLYKINLFIDSKRAGFSVPFLSVVSAILSIILGVVIVANPFKSVTIQFMFAGVALIVEAVVDIIAVIGASIEKKK